MSTFDIITDSTSDLSLELREKYAIDYYNGEFTLSAMRKYNTDNMAEIFAGQADKEIYGA